MDFQLALMHRNTFSLCIYTAPKPFFEASHYAMKSSLPLGNARIVQGITSASTVEKAFASIYAPLELDLLLRFFTSSIFNSGNQWKSGMIVFLLDNKTGSQGEELGLIKPLSDISFKVALISALKATIALLIIVVVVTVVAVVVVVTVVVVVVVVTVVVVISRPYPTVPGQMANPIAIITPRWTRTCFMRQLHLEHRELRPGYDFLSTYSLRCSLACILLYSVG
ncbi:hypothetical protein Tco_0309504 [Tanacetum coccineum]